MECMYHGDFWRRCEGNTGVRTVERSRGAARGLAGVGIASRAENAFVRSILEESVDEMARCARERGSESQGREK